MASFLWWHLGKWNWSIFYLEEELLFSAMKFLMACNKLLGIFQRSQSGLDGGKQGDKGFQIWKNRLAFYKLPGESWLSTPYHIPEFDKFRFRWTKQPQTQAPKPDTQTSHNSHYLFILHAQLITTFCHFFYLEIFMSHPSSPLALFLTYIYPAVAVQPQTLSPYGHVPTLSSLNSQHPCIFM